MMYLLIRNGNLVKGIDAVCGSEANRIAKEEGGIALLVVGRQEPDAIFDHVINPMAEFHLPTVEEINEEYISEEDIQRILDNDGVEVSSEKIDGDKDS